jgi:hypothetical protein
MERPSVLFLEFILAFDDLVYKSGRTYGNRVQKVTRTIILRRRGICKDHTRLTGNANKTISEIMSSTVMACHLASSLGQESLFPAKSQ